MVKIAFDIIQISLYAPIILHVGGVAGIEMTENHP